MVQARDPKFCWQAEADYWEPAFSGYIRTPLTAILPLPLDARKVICRRCAMELKKGNLISGGGLDVTCLGIGEVDKDGNNNVSRMGSRLTGPGGFIDTGSTTPKVIFDGTLMDKAKVKVGDGKLEILEEGTIRKFVDTVGQITFSGQYVPENQEVLYITERAVFKLIDHKMALIEIAPGIDLEKDVLAHMGFRPEISPELRAMDPAIFQEIWGGLKEYIKEEN